MLCMLLGFKEFALLALSFLDVEKGFLVVAAQLVVCQDFLHDGLLALTIAETSSLILCRSFHHSSYMNYITNLVGILVKSDSSHIEKSSGLER